MKTCAKCGALKPVDAFYKHMGKCKSCHNTIMKLYAKSRPERTAEIRNKWRAKPGSRAKEVEASKRWNREHPEQLKATRVHRDLRKYGITLTEYNQMWARQDFRCAICGTDESKLHVDHNHATNKVRGLLCGNCNTSIGLMRENVAVFQRAAQYVSA